MSSETVYRCDSPGCGATSPSRFAGTWLRMEVQSALRALRFEQLDACGVECATELLKDMLVAEARERGIES